MKRFSDLRRPPHPPAAPPQFSPEVVARLKAISQANNEPLAVTIVNMVIRGLDSLDDAEQS